jgi:glucose-6-phosphate dehydrogenase assembly protein OpcA
VKITLDAVDRELASLWAQEARGATAARMELLTLTAFASEERLLERARRAVAGVAAVHPSRTVVAVSRSGAAPGITAEVALHRTAPGAPARGDAIDVEAVGAARDWLPENLERLALPDLPACLWWVGDLPDADRLFDRLLQSADRVVVNSCEMDLRDLERLAGLARGRRGGGLADVTWTRLRPLLELVARFFDDEPARAVLPGVRRVTVAYSRRDGDGDAASTSAALLFGWIAHALALPVHAPAWSRGEGWAEVRLGGVAGRFEALPRADVPEGGVTRVTIEADGGRFEIVRQEDPAVFCWSREVPGAPVPQHTLRVTQHAEPTLLVRCLERPGRDALLEASLTAAARIVRPVAPRLSGPPPAA